MEVKYGRLIIDVFSIQKMGENKVTNFILWSTVKSAGAMSDGADEYIIHCSLY